MIWYVYVARCRDDTLYTGITTNIQRRELEHNINNKLGAKSVRSKRPIKIVYYETFSNQSEAHKREVDIKSWKRSYKLRLIGENPGVTRKFKFRKI
ncbi:GIY-YIG nuclease family protein [Candidatus Gottesmanbacteria bacterium]|nr:GIY-YIG nuclease family protein [Candidatus Gottesmanbacteria bacterium]